MVFLTVTRLNQLSWFLFVGAQNFVSKNLRNVLMHFVARETGESLQKTF